MATQGRPPLRVAGTAEKLGEPPEVLRGCCQQHFVPDAAQAPQPETVEPENALHVRKSHLNLLALPAGLLEGFRVGQGADTISHIFVDVTGDFAIAAVVHCGFSMQAELSFLLAL